MIYLFWSLYLLFALIISSLVRRLSNSRLIKSLSFSLTLSLLISIWFSRPGNTEIAPIFSILIFDFFQDGESNLMRLVRPFCTFFLIIIFFDFIIKIRRKKIKN